MVKSSQKASKKSENVPKCCLKVASKCEKKHIKNGQNCQNGSKWVKTGQKASKLVENISEPAQTGQKGHNGSKSIKKHQNRFKTYQNQSKTVIMCQNWSKSIKIGSDLKIEINTFDIPG